MEDRAQSADSSHHVTFGLLSLEVPIGKSNAVLVLGTPTGESVLLEYGAVGLRLSRLPAVVFIGF